LQHQPHEVTFAGISSDCCCSTLLSRT
jgi:hypothetical protein